MIEKNLVDSINLEKGDMFCEPRHLAKSHRLPFNKSDEDKRHYQVGEFFHSDIYGPMQVDSLGGSRYFINFKDDTSGYRIVDLINHKSDAYEYFVDFERQVTNKFGRTMKVLRTDNGREYCSNSMVDYMSKK